jgi:hypothetical protein
LKVKLRNEGPFQTASKVSETSEFVAVQPMIKEYNLFFSCGSRFLDERFEQATYFIPKKTLFFLRCMVV